MVTGQTTWRHVNMVSVTGVDTDGDGLNDGQELGLGDVGHFYPVGAVVENIQRHSGDQGIAQGILLIQETALGAGLLVPLLDLLHEHGRTATFFVVGEFAERHPDLVRRLLLCFAAY